MMLSRRPARGEPRIDDLEGGCEREMAGRFDSELAARAIGQRDIIADARQLDQIGRVA
jgi:hypothetical protein